MGAVLEGLAELVNGNEALVRRGRYLTTTFLVETGDTAWLVTVIEERPSEPLTRLIRPTLVARASHGPAPRSRK